MDTKGLGIFFGVLVIATAGLSAGLIMGEVIDFAEPGVLHHIGLVALACTPALAGLAVRVARGGSGLPPVAPIPRVLGVVVAISMPVVFLVLYTGTTLAGLSTPQWEMTVALQSIAGEGEPVPNLPGIGPVLVVAGWLLSIVLGATVFAAVALGQELGWRGFLFPALRPLGAVPAHAVTTLVWLLWCVPLAYAWSMGATGGLDAGLLLRSAGVLVLLSIMLNALVGRWHNVGLCALGLGAYLGQAAGIWRLLFPTDQPPYTGATGLVGLGLFAVLCVAVLLLTRRGGPGAQPAGAHSPAA